jgi:hypothetical protein
MTSSPEAFVVGAEEIPSSVFAREKFLHGWLAA